MTKVGYRARKYGRKAYLCLECADAANVTLSETVSSGQYADDFCSVCTQGLHTGGKQDRTDDPHEELALILDEAIDNLYPRTTTAPGESSNTEKPSRGATRSRRNEGRRQVQFPVYESGPVDIDRVREVLEAFGSDSTLRYREEEQSIEDNGKEDTLHTFTVVLD